MHRRQSVFPPPAFFTFLNGTGLCKYIKLENRFHIFFFYYIISDHFGNEFWQLRKWVNWYCLYANGGLFHIVNSGIRWTMTRDRNSSIYKVALNMKYVRILWIFLSHELFWCLRHNFWSLPEQNLLYLNLQTICCGIIQSVLDIKISFVCNIFFMLC